VTENGCQHSTNFTLSIEAASGVTTGISAADRAHTIRTAVARNAVPDDIVMPGHIFPLMAKPGGVLSRAGHTEAGCDLARLAGFEPAAAIVEIMNEDGTMARRPDLEVFAAEHDLKIGTIADLIQYRVVNEKTIELISVGAIETDYGSFDLHTFRDTSEGKLHFALVKGEIKVEEPTLVRVHLGATVRDLMCAKIPGKEQGWNIKRCLERVASTGKGVVLLVDSPETQDDLLASVEVAMGNKPKPKLDNGSSQSTYFTVGIGSQILRAVGVGKIRLMGPPIKYNAISGFDLEVVEFEPVEPQA
jgi:3,4-dihydroxy 2-butanone 4-phosphate synthase/GTP cyclohydrolase II